MGSGRLSVGARRLSVGSGSSGWVGKSGRWVWDMGGYIMWLGTGSSGGSSSGEKVFNPKYSLKKY